MDMKTMLSLLLIGSFSPFSVASAESYMYSEGSASASGGSSATVNLSTVMSGDPSNTQILVESNTGGLNAPPTGTQYIDDTYLTPQELQQYLRTLMSDTCFGAAQPCTAQDDGATKDRLERLREARKEMLSVPSGPKGKQEVRFEQHVENIGGTASGEVRVLRKENGKVVEDRVITLPKGAPGKPVFFRATSSIGTGTPPGFLIRGINANGSRAVFLRALAASTTLPFMGSFLHTGTITSPTVDSYGNILFSFEQKRPPIAEFLGKVFNMFGKATGNEQ